MHRPAIYSLCLCALGASSVQAQHPNAKAADSAAAMLVGVWSGQYESDHAPPGTFVLTVGKDSVWTGKVDLTMGGQLAPARVSDFKVDGNNLSWTVELMGMPCKGTAVLAAATLRGEMTCDHASVSYVLKRK